jgi:Amt family ammonium transporter
MRRLRRYLTASLGLVAAPVLCRAAEADWTPPPVDTGTTAWMLVSTALVLLMVPALAMFYGGLTRTKNVLGTMMHSFAAMAIIGVLWCICGYAMCFGASLGWCGWDPKALFLQGIDHGPDAYMPITVNGVEMAIPTLVFAMFQGKFAIITPALIAGSFAERVRFSSYCLFIALWSLLVYNPLAHWVWGGGFLTGDAIDFAGGTVIHISAGVAGLMTILYLGARRGYPTTVMQPNNLVMTLMGAGLLWVGWFGFNAGSSVASGLQTAQALTVTQVAAAAGALSWIAIEAIRYRKSTTLGFVSGILAGLVAITPAAGDVQPYAAIILGVVASLACYGAIAVRSRLKYDDTLDVLGIHGTAGIVGAIGLSFLLRPSPDRLPFLEQLWFQVQGVGVSIAYSAVMTLIIVVVIDKLIGFRLDEDDERAGMDHSLHGEQGYGMLSLG